MDRQEAGPGGVVEDLLRAVAMVDVEVDDEDPVELEVGQGLLRGQCDVAVNAETHPGGRAGVVSRWADQAQGAPLRPRHDERHRFERRPCGQSSRQARARPEPGVRIEHPPAASFQVGDLLEVFARMHPGQLLRRGLAHQASRTRVVVARPLELAEDGVQALGPLRVVGRHAVIEHATIRKESDDHGASLGGTTPEVMFRNPPTSSRILADLGASRPIAIRVEGST